MELVSKCRAVWKESLMSIPFVPPTCGTRGFSFPGSSGYSGVPDDSHIATDHGANAAPPATTQTVTARKRARAVPAIVAAPTTARSAAAGATFVRIATTAAAVTPTAAAVTTV